MKHLSILCFIFLTRLNLRFCLDILNEPKLFSSLPYGKYQLNIKSVFPCKSQEKYKIQLNFNLYQMPNNTKLITGNFTNLIEINDSLSILMNIGFKDRLQGWKEKLFEQKFPRAFTSFKRLMGKAYSQFLNGLGMSETMSSLRPGVYVSKGIDVKIFEDTEFPKSFTYGTFKMQYLYTGDNEILSCTVFIVELNRP